MNQVYENAMRRALELALLGPAAGVNPQVGAVILDASGAVIAEGYHRGAGTAHAEVDALSKLSVVPAGSTAVVTLEPCNHTGRTGPCAQALIDAGVSRVVFAVTDPGEFSSGGAETLSEAGVEVVAGLLEAEAENQLRVWLWWATNNHPWVTLKWASSLDGRAAADDGSSKWISGPESRAHAHKFRSSVDAILVGTGTVVADNPELTARKPDGLLYETQPVRVVMGNRDLPAEARVFNDDAPTSVYKTHDVAEILQLLWAQDIKHVLVEGGPKVASAFIEAGLVNEYIVYLAPKLLGGSRVALQDIGVGSIGEATEMHFESVERLGDDILIRARSEHVHWDY
jgi:diaminohydroxyphosphoribosylaminopyrimidine deaminase/5-amino-6-(5-phosphoribosylamino)uracil reductase